MKNRLKINLWSGVLAVFLWLTVIILGFMVLSYVEINEQISTKVWLIFLIAGGVGIVWALFFAICFVFRPIIKLQKAIKKLEAINPEKPMDLWASADALADSMHTLLEELRQSLKREHAEVVLRQQSKYAELQNQINPHFLYNTLETIRGQAIIDDNYKIAEMTEALAKYFRYNISKDSDLVLLEQELENIRNYIQIQQYRFQDRFVFNVYPHCERDEYAYCQLPKMTLQPIVENAIFHGMEQKIEKGHISIHIEVTQERLILSVADDGVGMNEATLTQLNEKLKNSDGVSKVSEKNGHHGIAMENIQSRLRLLYGMEYGICVSSMEGLGTEVEITLPRIIGDLKG